MRLRQEFSMSKGNTPHEHIICIAQCSSTCLVLRIIKTSHAERDKPHFPNTVRAWPASQGSCSNAEKCQGLQKISTAQSGCLGGPGQSHCAHLGEDNIDGTGRRGDVGLKGELLALGHDCFQLLVQDLLGNGSQVVHQLIHRPDSYDSTCITCRLTSLERQGISAMAPHLVSVEFSLTSLLTGPSKERHYRPIPNHAQCSA